METSALSPYNIEKSHHFQAAIRLSLDEARIMCDWHAFKGENKIINILSGTVSVLVVKLDNWENPAHNLQVQELILSAKDDNKSSFILPSGYAVNFKASVHGSQVEISPGINTEKTIAEEYKYSRDRWYFESFF